MLAPRLGTRSYAAERAEQVAPVRDRPTGRDDGSDGPARRSVYDDGRVVVNVTCNGCGGGGPEQRPDAYGYGAVMPSLPGLWPLPPLSLGFGNLPPGFIYGASPCYGAPPMLLPPVTAWSPYVANPGAFCG